MSKIRMLTKICQIIARKEFSLLLYMVSLTCEIYISAVYCARVENQNDIQIVMKIFSFLSVVQSFVKLARIFKDGHDYKVGFTLRIA